MSWKTECDGAISLTELYQYQQSLMGKQVRVRAFLVVDYGRPLAGREDSEDVKDTIFDAALIDGTDDDDEMYRRLYESDYLPPHVVNIEGVEENSILGPLAAATDFDSRSDGLFLYSHSIVMTGILTPASVPDIPLGIIPIEATVLRNRRADGRETATFRMR